MQLWKKRMVNRLSLAAPFYVGISSLCNGGPLHHRSRRLGDHGGSTETSVNTIGTKLADDDSLSQRHIAPAGISQTTVKKIILSLFFPAISIGVYAYSFLHKTFVRAFYLRYRADFFSGDVTNSGLHAASFTFSIRGVPDL